MTTVGDIDGEDKGTFGIPAHNPSRMFLLLLRLRCLILVELEGILN
jgi:hypothetical protein